MPTVYDLPPETFHETLREWGEPEYRARQVVAQLWKRGASYREMTDIPVSLRERLAESLPTNVEVESERLADDGATLKGLLRVGGEHLVEVVLMGYPAHTTVCISSQVGCAMACSFCATGTMGLVANLTSGEIVGQVVWAARRAGSLSEDTSRQLTHIVFMGMGEPLSNYRAVSEAIAKLTSPDGLGIGSRRITVSTVGIAPNMRRLARDHPQVGLALSLHAADDALRSNLVPANDLWPISQLIDAAQEWREVTHRRLSIEWTLMDGVNDNADQARRLGKIASRLGAHVNVIPMNAVSGIQYGPTPAGRVRDFVRVLRDTGANVTIRDTRGKEIDAACGQLRLTHLQGISRLRERATGAV